MFSQPDARCAIKALDGKHSVAQCAPPYLAGPFQMMEYSFRFIAWANKEYEVSAFADDAGSDGDGPCPEAPPIRTCDQFIDTFEQAIETGWEWYSRLRPPYVDDRGRLHSTYTASIHALLVLQVPRLRAMWVEEGVCLVGWMSTASMETSHQFTRLHFLAHTAMGGCLKGQLCTMGMLLRSILKVRCWPC
jgi:hypothetical protein|eukprot:COSAG01_NODE_259_length_20069_cov_21.507762_18_plen_190_part_00